MRMTIWTNIHFPVWILWIWLTSTVFQARSLCVTDGKAQTHLPPLGATIGQVSFIVGWLVMLLFSCDTFFWLVLQLACLRSFRCLMMTSLCHLWPGVTSSPSFILGWLWMVLFSQWCLPLIGVSLVRFCNKWCWHWEEGRIMCALVKHTQRWR